MTWIALVGSLVYLFDLAIKAIALGTVPKNRRPASGMAWLLVIFSIPLLGLVIFAMLGLTRLDRKRHERQHQLNVAIESYASHLPALQEGSSVSGQVADVARLNRSLGALTMTAGNRVDLLPSDHDPVGAMTAAVDAAEHYVHVEFYITACDRVTEPFFDALDRAIRRGVTVRLLLDHLGSRGIPGYPEFKERLNRSGILWHEMLPLHPLRGQFRRPDLRNHRKILVVDGTVGFSGSQNLIEPGYNKPVNHKAGREWFDVFARVEGPMVAALNVLFATDWNAETGEVLTDELSVLAPSLGNVSGQVIPSGPGVVAENNLRAFTSLIYSARTRLSLTSPYFVPDESLLYAVTTAAERGVAVELFASEEKEQFMVYHAQRSYYEALLRAGVRIYLYPSPAVLHSKHMSVDDDVAVIGSSNMDMRSFALNYEVSMMLTGGDVVARMRAVEDEYRAKSRELSLDEWLTRPRRAAYIDNVMRLTAALQ